MERYRAIGNEAQPRGDALAYRRAERRSYLYEPPQLSARRVRRQTGIVMAALGVLLAIAALWGLIAILHWLAAGIGTGLMPRVGAGSAGGTIRSVMMTLPLA